MPTQPGDQRLRPQRADARHRAPPAATARIAVLDQCAQRHDALPRQPPRDQRPKPQVHRVSHRGHCRRQRRRLFDHAQGDGGEFRAAVLLDRCLQVLGERGRPMAQRQRHQVVAHGAQIALHRGRKSGSGIAHLRYCLYIQYRTRNRVLLVLQISRPRSCSPGSGINSVYRLSRFRRLLSFRALLLDLQRHDRHLYKSSHLFGRENQLFRFVHRYSALEHHIGSLPTNPYVSFTFEPNVQQRRDDLIRRPSARGSQDSGRAAG